MYAVRDMDSFQDGETFTTADGAILTVKKIKNGILMSLVLGKRGLLHERKVPSEVSLRSRNG
ncbi:hypothetical protein DPMN_150720 [Dreissena polymorpha]|uniref:Uncharacterized protein n=1 Tax=Dreissena polymorpha TaxID=45954 RepID=A0A9D4FII1_DREPO|nr:hypothetical protein DPMN_150720 [Dreissena polymorpha]